MLLKVQTGTLIHRNAESLPAQTPLPTKPPPQQYFAPEGLAEEVGGQRESEQARGGTYRRHGDP